MSDDKLEEEDSSKNGLLEKIGNFFQGEPKNQDELLTIIDDAKQREIIDQKTKDMIKGVLDVSKLRVRDIMIPRSQMITLGLEQSVEEFLPLLIETAHSRFPVITENKDHIVGLLLAKDLLKFGFKQKSNDFKIEDVLREAVVGLVTIEDILEVIVGEIEDEFDAEDEDEIRQIGKKTYMVNALTSIEDFNDYFSSKYKTEEQDTIGGLITHQLGHLPSRGESVNIQGYKFKITNADSRRLVQLQVRIPKELKKVD